MLVLFFVVRRKFGGGMEREVVMYVLYLNVFDLRILTSIPCGHIAPAYDVTAPLPNDPGIVRICTNVRVYGTSDDSFLDSCSDSTASNIIHTLLPCVFNGYIHLPVKILPEMKF